jgi:alpha-amylase/alpha-mannosidase (GH57 family)
MPNNGGNDIRHPDERMTVDERSFQMWAVHPKDLDELGFRTRQAFFTAHLEAAILQASLEPEVPTPTSGP